MNEPAIETYTGTLLVTPRCSTVPPFRREGTWKLIEDPEHRGQFFWVSSTASFAAEICEKIE